MIEIKLSIFSTAGCLRTTGKSSRCGFVILTDSEEQICRWVKTPNDRENGGVFFRNIS